MEFARVNSHLRCFRSRLQRCRRFVPSRSAIGTFIGVTEWTHEAVRAALEIDARFLPVDVHDVRLDGNKVVIEFTTDSRPGCRFAYSEPAFPSGQWVDEFLRNETPEMYATQIRVQLQEEIEAEGYGLPEDCVAGELTWVR